MHDLTNFERRLVDRLRAELKVVTGPTEAGRVAATAMVPRSPRDRLLNRLALDPLPLRPAARAGVLVGTAALLALLAAAIAVGVAKRTAPVLAFVRANGDVVLAAGDGSVQTVIGHIPPQDHYVQIESAPGGTHIAISDGAHLTVLSRAGQVFSRTPLDTGSSRFEWAPDGQRLAILDGPIVKGEGQSCYPLIQPRLDVITPDGSVVWTAPLPPGFRYWEGAGELAWSPDGRRLAIVGSVRPCTLDDGELPTSIWLVDLDAGSVRELTTQEPDVADFHPFWLPDGRLMYSLSGIGLRQVDPATGETSVVLDLAGACAGCEDGSVIIEDVSRDGTRLALRHSGLRPMVLDLVTRSITVITRDVEAGVALSPVFWSPDGSAILFDYRPNAGSQPTVVAVDVATGQMRELLADTEFFAVLD